MSELFPVFKAATAALTLLGPCDAELGRAAVALDPADRFISAHMAAVAAALALINNLTGKKSRHTKRGVWEQLVNLDRQWQPWAAVFAGGSRLRQALEMGVPVGAKVADEMTALAEDFRDEVAMQLDPNCTWSQPVQPTQNLNQSSLRLAS